MMNIRHYLYVGCLLITISCGVVESKWDNGSTDEANTMTTNEDQAMQLLDLPIADYFSFDEEKQLALQKRLAKLSISSAPPGVKRVAPQILVLGAAKQVNLDERANVPLLIGRVQSGLRSWQVNYKTNLHLFTRDLQTGQLRVLTPFVSMRRGEAQLLSGAGTPPEGVNAQVMHTSVTMVDLREQLGEQISSGRLMVTAVAHEQRSNSVAIELESRVPPAESSLSLPQPYISSQFEKSTPLETKIVVPDRAQLNGDGVIDIAIQVREAAGVQRTELGEAIWAANLVLVQLDRPVVIIPMSVAVQEVSTADGPSMFNALFQLELKQVTQDWVVGDYQLYLDVGMEMLGPYPLTITD
ncbi:MAG: hypothetical protein L3J28_04595 [Candidatus Polarisedimenticolaceae bacterium]|nr:hypothetical protein [Candidatus Polarisedimenticolaceae bacterium]